MSQRGYQPHPHRPSHREMYLAGIMDHFSAAPKMELIVWGSTVGKLVFGLSGVRDQLKRARSVAGGIKPGSTGPSIWTNLALLGQLCGFILPQFVFVTAIAYNKFHQPEWMTEHALPSPPDVLGIDGVVIGRTVGLLVLHAVASLTQTALRALGDQYHAIGVSALLVLPDHNRRLTFFLGCR